MKEISEIFILDNVKSVRFRLQLLLNTKYLNIFEASNSSELFNIFLENRCSGNLIIMDIELKDEDGFEVIRKIRDKNKNIPIIILTSANNRESFIKAIFAGATDYILKPFGDLQIKDKINKTLNLYNNQKETEHKIVFNLPYFLQSEFTKSKKGKYSISIMMATLYKHIKINSNEVENEDLILSNIFYNELKNIIWDTDVVTKYGPQSFIGVFPFANKDNVNIICNKVNECFNNLKQDNKIPNEYSLSNVFVTYPEEVTEADDIILKLIGKTKETIANSENIFSRI